jgi:hypothetical protein
MYVSGAVFFLLYGLGFKHIAEFAQRIRGHSDKVKALGIKIMRPACFVMSAVCIAFALMLFFG